MRIVLQRVRRASVSVEGKITGAIGPGLLLLLGVGEEDSAADAQWLVEKIVRLRIFPDEEEKMNLSLLDCGGEALVVSQFTLFGSLKKGNRPSFNRSAPPELARERYAEFCRLLSAALCKPVPTGVFGAMMEVELLNDGPVTLLLDSRQRDF